MPDFPPAQAVVPLAARGDRAPVDAVSLDYDARFLRRKRLMTEGGRGMMVDLPETVSISAGDCFELLDGRLVEVRAAAEPVMVIRGANLPRLAWHIGNRHTPCQIGVDHLVIREDHVLQAMLVQLGASVVNSMAPFSPEGGAYGLGRTMGHDHGPAQGHSHGHAHVVALPGLRGAPLHVQTRSSHGGDPEAEAEPETGPTGSAPGRGDGW